MDWGIDENNIEKNAYPSSRGDKRIEGLGERDAYAFSADFTLFRRVLAWFMLRIVYPLRFTKQGTKRNSLNNLY